MILSIITINYNNKFGLDKTIKSVITQSWVDYEFIVIDGGSSDGSLDVIINNKDKLSYWVSEPDNGVFHAMNKGIVKAKGDYLLMLNSGDFLFCSDVLSQVFEFTDLHQDILYGDVFRESKGAIIDESIFPDQLDLNFLYNETISHQATFVKRELHNRVGLYDERLKLSSDWKFIILAICQFNSSFKHLNFKIAVCNCDGLTCSPSNFYRIRKEREAVLKFYFPIFYDINVLKANQNLNVFSRAIHDCQFLIQIGKVYIKNFSSKFLTFLKFL